MIRALFLLRQMIRASEKGGTHGVRPHQSLSKGQYLDTLSVTNSITTQGDGCRSRIQISMDSHATVWDLKKKIGEEVVKTSKDDGKTWGFYPKAGETEPRKPIHPATIRVFQMATTSDLKDATHGSTLAEVKFKPNENLSAFKKSAHLHRKAAVIEDGEDDGQPVLTPKAKIVAREIFERFSTDGIMTKEHCINFTATCTGTESGQDDPRVASFIEKYAPMDYQSVSRFFVDACVAGQDLILR